MSNERPTAAKAPLQKDLARALEALKKFEVESLQKHIDSAIDFARASVDALVNSGENHADALTVLGACLQRRYQTSTDKNIGDIDEAVKVTRNVIEVIMQRKFKGDAGIYFVNLERVLKFWCGETKGTTQIDESTKIVRQVIDLIPEGSPAHAFALKTLSGLYTFGYEQTKRPEYLNEAINAAKLAVSITPEKHPFRVTMLEKLSDLHSDRFEETRSILDVDDLISISNELVEIRQGDSDYQLAFIHNIAAAFTSRYKLTNDLADLEKAIEYGQAAAKPAPAISSARRPFLAKEIMLHKLRMNTRTYFERTSDVPEFDEDIIDSLHIEGIVDKGNINPAEGLCHLADAFHRRYEKSKRVVDIEYARLCTAKALGLIDDSHEEWEAIHDRYRARYRLWSEQTGKMPDCEIVYMAFGNGSSWIPPEMEVDLELKVPWFVFTGELSTEIES